MEVFIKKSVYINTTSTKRAKNSQRNPKKKTENNTKVKKTVQQKAKVEVEIYKRSKKYDLKKSPKSLTINNNNKNNNHNIREKGRKKTLKLQNQQQEPLPCFSSPTPRCRSGPVCSPPPPPFFHPAQSCTDLYGPFLWPKTPANIQPVFCEKCCVSRCTPDASVERDALHVHLLFHHLGSPAFISLIERIYCHFWLITFCFSFYNYRCIC